MDAPNPTEALAPAPERFQGLARPGDLKEVQGRILKTALEEFGADVCALYSLNPIDGRFFERPRIAGDLRHPQPSEQRPRPEGLTQCVVREELVHVPALAEQPKLASAFTEREGIQAFTAVALKEPRTGKALAVLYIDFREPRELDDDDRERLSHFVPRAASWLQTAWLLARYRQVARVGFEINQDLRDAGTLFSRLDLHAQGILDAGYFFALGVYSWQSETVRLFYRSGERAGEEKALALTGEIRRVFETGKHRFLEHLDPTIPDEHGLQGLDDVELRPGSGIFAPLLLRGVALGILVVLHPDEKAFDDEDLSLLSLLANHAASAVSGIRLFYNQTELNRTGQHLADLRNPRESLDRVVAEIREATRADFVALYPYFEELRTFHLPPKGDGSLIDAFPQPTTCQRGDVPYRVVEQERPLFLVDAAELWESTGASPPPPGRGFQEREEVTSLAVVPLRFQRETVGVLFVNFRRRQPFDGAQKLLIQGLSVFAAVAIRNARRFLDQEIRREEEFEALQEIDRIIASESESRVVLTKILEAANQVLGAGDAAVLLTEEGEGGEGPKLWMASAIGRHAEESLGWTTRDSEHSLVQWVFDNRSTVCIEDVYDESRWRDRFHQLRPTTRSELDVPLIDGRGGVVGVLNFESATPGAFTEDDELFAETLARQVLLAVQRAQDAEVAKKEAAENHLLMKLSKEIIGEIELEELLGLILDNAMKNAGASAGVLLLYDPEHEELEVVQEQGAVGDNKNKRFRLSEGIIGYVAKTGEIENIDPTAPKWKDIHLAYAKGTRSELTVPLKGERLWGVLNIESPIPRRFGDREVRLTKALANFAVVALQNADRFWRSVKTQGRLRALQDVTRKIVGQVEDLDRAMRSIVQYSVDLIDHGTLARLGLWRNGSLATVYRYSVSSQTRATGVGKRELSEEDAASVGGVFERVASTRMPYRSRGGSDGQGPLTDLEIDGAPVLSEVAVPLTDETTEAFLGVLAVYSTKPSAFQRSDQELLGLFADEAVLAIQNARSYEAVDRQRRRFEALVRTGEALGEFSSREQFQRVCRVVALQAAEQCDCLAVVRLHDAREEELVLVEKALGPEAERELARMSNNEELRLFNRMKDSEGLNGRARETRQTQHQPDTKHPEPGSPVAVLKDARLRSIVVAPIVFGDTFLGNLAMCHVIPHVFDRADRVFAEGLAQLLAVTHHRLEAIQAQQKAQEQSKEFEIAGVINAASTELAHRLSGDLGAIRIWLQNVEDRLGEIGEEEALGDIEASLERVEKILAQNRKLQNEIKTLDEPDALRAISLEVVFEDLRTQFRETSEGLILNLEGAEAVGDVLAIPDYPRDILHNLISNAVTAIGRGRIDVRAGIRGRFAEIVVRDDGPGIPPENLKKIFNFRFSTKKSTGIGLWLSRIKARLCGGNLTAESEPGRGATLLLTLPLVEEPPEAQFHPEAGP